MTYLWEPVVSSIGLTNTPINFKKSPIIYKLQGQIYDDASNMSRLFKAFKHYFNKKKLLMHYVHWATLGLDYVICVQEVADF